MCACTARAGNVQPICGSCQRQAATHSCMHTLPADTKRARAEPRSQPLARSVSRHRLQPPPCTVTACVCNTFAPRVRLLQGTVCVPRAEPYCRQCLAGDSPTVMACWRCAADLHAVLTLCPRAHAPLMVISCMQGYCKPWLIERQGHLGRLGGCAHVSRALAAGVYASCFAAATARACARACRLPAAIEQRLCSEHERRCIDLFTDPFDQECVTNCR